MRKLRFLPPMRCDDGCGDCCGIALRISPEDIAKLMNELATKAG